MSEVVGRKVQLVSVSHEHPRRVEDKREQGMVGFADGFPLTVASTESLALVNQKLQEYGHDSIKLTRARSTLTLDGLILPEEIQAPADAFPEDYVAAIKNGDIILERAKACGRCPVPNIDELSGRQNGSPVTKVLGALGRSGWHNDRDRYDTNRHLFWTQNFTVKIPVRMGSDTVIKISKNTPISIEYSAVTNWHHR